MRSRAWPGPVTVKDRSERTSVSMVNAYMLARPVQWPDARGAARWQPGAMTSFRPLRRVYRATGATGPFGDLLAAGGFQPDPP